jgi:hypothetical protein
LPVGKQLVVVGAGGVERVELAAVVVERDGGGADELALVVVAAAINCEVEDV